MDNENQETSTRKSRKDMNREVLNQLTTANQMFVRNDFQSCITTLKSILKRSPKNSKAYFMLGLVFEEMGEDIKAYNFYLISSQLMKTNWSLWGKLYDLSTKLNLLTDKLYYIQMLQKKYNKRDLVDEKLQLYRILKSKYKILETKIEMFYFDGVDFDIFNIIRTETKHKTRTAQCCLLLIKFYKQYSEKCGLDFLMNIFRLQYDTGYLIGTRNLIERYLLVNNIRLPNDIKIIYIICCLMNKDTSPKEEVNNNKDMEDLDFREFSEKVFESKESIFNDLKNRNRSFDIYIKDDNLEFYREELSKTLSLDSLLGNKNPFDKFSSIDFLISDTSFWDTFNEPDYIKGLLEVLKDSEHDDQYIKILKILERRVDSMNEYVFSKFGDFYSTKKDLNNSLFYYQKTLEVNPDNNSVKSKLYEIYKNMGNLDLAHKFRTISSLVNFVEDIENEDKSKLISTKDKCNENRDQYLKTRALFKTNMDEYHEKVKPLVEDFLENRFIFTKLKRYKLVDADSKLCTDKALIYEDDRDSLRLLSLHGLDTNEWSAVLLEYIISNIVKGKFKEASFLLKKCLECDLFKKEKDIYTQFIFLTIKHSIHYNDLNLLSNCFKNIFYVFKDYSWANFLFYLLHFFPDYILKRSYGNIVRNIRRVFRRNYIHISGKRKEEYKTIYRSLDLNILLSTFFMKNIIHKSYKIINSIILSDSFKDKMIYNIILIITYKSRANENKNEMLRKGINGLKSLLSICSNEEYFNLSYNIGIAYHMLGYVGFAEKHYTETLLSKNIELRRMARLSLIIIYRKANNLTMLKKVFEEDDYIEKKEF
jgi:tetratricopeptide (TPR) repeat protein